MFKLNNEIMEELLYEYSDEIVTVESYEYLKLELEKINQLNHQLKKENETLLEFQDGIKIQIQRNNQKLGESKVLIDEKNKIIEELMKNVENLTVENATLKTQNTIDKKNKFKLSSF